MAEEVVDTSSDRAERYARAIENIEWPYNTIGLRYTPNNSVSALIRALVKERDYLKKELTARDEWRGE